MLERIYKSKKKMRLHSNEVKMVIDHKLVVAGYIKDVCFYKTAITNIFSLKNLIQKYIVTYDSLDQIVLFTARKTTIPICTLECIIVVSTTMNQLKMLPL